jgi:hypothetical protein
MPQNNYCLIKTNKIYEELYDILEDNELVMDRPNDKDNIKYQIQKLLNSYFDKKNISLSNIFDTTEETLSDFMCNITNDEEENLQGNTLLMYANSNAMYEIVFMEQLNINKNDDELNQFSAIGNIELSPIYGNTAIIKSSYNEKTLISSIVLKEDIEEIFINNFYHMGVLINTDGSFKELEFTGENPNIVIGNNFKMMQSLQLFGLQFVCFNDDEKQENILASILYGNNIKGRMFVAVLCPITNKRFWSINIEFINNVLKLLKFTTGTPEQKKIISELDKELDNDKMINPFFLIKKYSV